MNLDEALQTFLVEGRELLEEMEAALLRVAEEDDPAESINAIFRAAHTIKGSAGLFGLDAIVAFTHVVESLLDEVRDGAVQLSDKLIQLLLACGDHIGSLIDAVDAGEAGVDPQLQQAGEGLIASLNWHMAATAQRSPRAPRWCCRRRRRPPSSVSRRPTAAPTTGTSRCASAATCCATAWTRSPSSATWQRSAASSTS